MQFRAAVKSLVVSGFTLVELSIVLVIIGLIIGGIFVGRDLIAAAMIRSQVSQISRWNAAVNTFKGKYGYLPGDISDAHASAFGLPPCDCDAFGGGNEDGAINDRWGSGETDIPIQKMGSEPGMFFPQLSAAQLIPETVVLLTTEIMPGSPYPASPIAGGFLPTSYTDGHIYYMSILATGLASASYGYGNVYLVNPVFTPSVAQSIDSKIDDGNPNTGAVWSFMRSSSQPAPDTNVNSCITSPTSNEYYTANTAVACHLMIRSVY